MLFGVGAGLVLTTPIRVLAAVGDQVVFRYGVSVSDPPATYVQLGFPDVPGTLPNWATVTLTEQAAGRFWMDIETSFDPTDGSDPSLTQLALNLNTDYSAYQDPFTLFSPFCTPNSSLTKTTCDSYDPNPKKSDIKLLYTLDGQGITGAGQPKGGFDLLVQLPPPGVKLDNAQSPIRLYVQGPTDDFGVLDFFEAVSTRDGYQTAAKVQELIGRPGSTVITGTGTYNPGGEPEGSPVPGPLPLFGAAAAFGFSRRLRFRITADRPRAASTN